jgi:lipopolysaccharide transport system permease protein
MTIAGFDRRDLPMVGNLFKLTLTDRYLGSTLGLAWSGVVAAAVDVHLHFRIVFPGRLQGREGALPYIIWLFSGYGPWLAISEGLSVSTISVVSNTGIIKNIAFKSEVLPVVGALTGFLPLLVSLGLISILQLIAGELPSPALLSLPVAFGLQILFVSGLELCLAALNVFVRDTALALPNLLTLLLFASPIFYPLNAHPHIAREISQFNPFYVIAACYYAPILDGVLPPLWTHAYLAVVSTAIFMAGLWWFRRLKSFFDTRL